MESSSLTEALRQREQAEQTAKREAERATAALAAHEAEGARMRHEREQMRQANARMQSLLERLRYKMSQQAIGGGGGSFDLAADATAALKDYIGAVVSTPHGHEVGSAARRRDERLAERYEPPPQLPPPTPQPPVLFDTAPNTAPSPPLAPPPPQQQQPPQQPQQPPRRTVDARPPPQSGGAGSSTPRGGGTTYASSRRVTMGGGTVAAASSRPSRLQQLANPVGPVAARPGAHLLHQRGGGGRGRGATPRLPPQPSTPATEAPPQGGKGAGGASAAAIAQEPVAPRTPVPERRSAALVLQLASLRAWLQECLGEELPPGDLPTLLEDGSTLLALIDQAMPGIAPPLAGSAAPAKFAAFSTACLQLGVPEHEVLPASAWQPGPQRSAEAIAAALAALAREAAARSMLPAL